MKYRGVNLGGWLVLERWMTPSLFLGTNAKDEFQLCTELGDAAPEKLDAHRKSFITHDDLLWVRDAGLNAVRLPVPHWAFDAPAPYVACGEYIDWLVQECGELGLKVLLDVHTAPGSQNGQDHSGRSGPIEWAQHDNIAKTSQFIDELADRYGTYEQVLGFEPLNEPHHSLKHKVLLNFYWQAIERIHEKYPEKLVVVSDAYRPRDWKDSELGDLPNVMLDMHLYQAFSDSDRQLAATGHVKKATVDWHHLIDELEHTLPVIVGEWSLATGKQFSENELLAFAIAQLSNFKHAAGWFFWSYKTEGTGPWNFQYLFDRGYIPAKLLQ